MHRECFMPWRRLKNDSNLLSNVTLGYKSASLAMKAIYPFVVWLCSPNLSIQSNKIFLFALNIVKQSAKYLPLHRKSRFFILTLLILIFCHCIFVSVVFPVIDRKLLLHSVRLNCCNLLCDKTTARDRLE